MSLRIASVEKSKRGDGYILHFDGTPALEVPETVVAKFGLLPGRELADSELESVKSECGKQTARAKAAAMIGAQPLTEKELKRRLSEKGVNKEDAEEACGWLRDMGALDDAEYAAALVRRCAAKGYGKARIKDEFFRRGVPRELWDEALSEYAANEESIDRLLRAKLKNGVGAKELKKASDALYRRGFSWDEIHEAISRYKAANETPGFDSDNDWM